MKEGHNKLRAETFCTIIAESPWYFQFQAIEFIIFADLSRTPNKYGSRRLLSQVLAWIIYDCDPICKSAGATKLQHKKERANEVLFPLCQQAAMIMFIRFP